MVEIRKMQVDEIEEIRLLAKRSFSFLEGIWLSKPKTALVATLDGQIVGALVYDFIYSERKKIGYVDYVFIIPEHRGHSIGNILYREGCEYLCQQVGCDALAALVKDDNVGSWKLFDRVGFKRVSIKTIIQHFGFGGFLKQYFLFPWFLAIGMDYYFLLNDGEILPNKSMGIKQIVTYILVNIAIAGIWLYKMPNLLTAVIVYGTILLADVLSGFWGTKASKQKWRFSFTNGGAAISLFMNMFVFYPMIGRWYPVEFSKTSQSRRDMGMATLISWMTLFLFVVFFTYFEYINSIFNLLAKQMCFLIIYRCVPIYPFESFGGLRVWKWSKVAFLIMVLLTVSVTYFSFIGS